jgi:hypothetical protein
LQLTDSLIDGAIDSISGFISARAAREKNMPLVEVMEAFMTSNTYRLLADKKTGLYWDSLPETYEMFLRELKEQEK